MSGIGIESFSLLIIKKSFSRTLNEHIEESPFHFFERMKVKVKKRDKKNCSKPDLAIGKNFSAVRDVWASKNMDPASLFSADGKSFHFYDLESGKCLNCMLNHNDNHFACFKSLIPC